MTELNNLENHKKTKLTIDIVKANINGTLMLLLQVVFSGTTPIMNLIFTGLLEEGVLGKEKE